MDIKETKFDRVKAGNDYFDLVSLEDIYKREPQDHNQFEHHKISFFVVVLIREGTGQHAISYNDYTYKKGSVFFLRKNSIHKFYKSDAEGDFLVFTEEFIVRYADKSQTLKLFQLFNEMLASPKLQLEISDFNEVEHIVLFIEKEYKKVNDKHSIEIIRNLIQVLLHKLLRIKSRANNNIGFTSYHRQFKDFQELVERDCVKYKKVAYYAKEMGVSSRTINNITQHIIGKSAKSFINEILIMQIKALIINSNFTFTEIAYHSGFEDPSNFFKYFRKQTNLSPKQFKEKHK